MWNLDQQHAILAELRNRFPWLETDDDANGADTVDAIAEWYEELKAATR